MKGENPEWVIYLLLNERGEPFYVGMSIDICRRIREHARTLGYRPAYEILECGTGDGWSEAERYWIAEYRRLGSVRNIANGGSGSRSVALSTRQKISMAHTGKPRPPGWGEMIAAKTRGKPHDISPEARASMARTQFKSGQPLHPVAREKNRLRLLASNARKTPEQRSREATARNIDAWSRRTPEERSALGQKIALARKRNREARGV